MNRKPLTSKDELTTDLNIFALRKENQKHYGETAQTRQNKKNYEMYCIHKTKNKKLEINFIIK